jgi:serine phosphatase RsbU (regulator of sigma subunit)
MDVLERFAETLNSEEPEVLDHLRAFIEWYVGPESEFIPSSDDDVALRTYLMQMKMNGASAKSQNEQVASLRRFYDWAESAGFVPDYHPFTYFTINRPSLTRAQIRRRKEIFSGSPEEREISRLRALNQLAEQLNRSFDVQTTLTAALETLVSLMSLQTAWAFLLPTASSPLVSVSVSSSDRFSLAAACGLPPGLEKNDRHHLKDVKLCHCQAVMLDGNLKRAVNIVECTRLNEAAREDGDNQGLMFHASVPILASGQPFGIMNVATQDWQFLTAADLQLLSAVGAQVAIALERARLYDVTHAQRLRLERELKLAREIQDSLLPDALPQIPGFSLAADWRSALEMAGDFYDIFPLPDGHWGIVVADVSDKGAAAAMYMAMTRSLIRASASNNSNPAGTLHEVNQRLLAHSTSDMFVTVFYAVLDAETQTLTYANAGQNPPLLRRISGRIEKLTRTGAALGVLEELTLSDASLILAPGDSLVIYTDGVTDALNPQGEEYGTTRLADALLNVAQSDAKHLLDHLTSDLAAFTQDVPPFDDITFFILINEQARIFSLR